jgi:hypothetical protein
MLLYERKKSPSKRLLKPEEITYFIFETLGTNEIPFPNGGKKISLKYSYLKYQISVHY